MAKSQSSLAIVLRWRPYAESDKIATFLTEDFGKLTGIAKGAKNSRRRFANSLEPLARVRVYFNRRPQATLAFLESCEMLSLPESFADPTRLAYGSYLIELADQMTVEDQPVRDLYALLEEATVELACEPATSSFLRGFELQLLARAGYEPQLERCTRCQREFPEAGPVFLSFVHGTFWCPDCRVHEEALVEVTQGLLPRLAALKALPLSKCREQSLGEASSEAAQLTGHLLALHLTRPLRSVKLIGQLQRGVA